MISVPVGTVCITGCSRGLGRSMALEFARLGWKVNGCARTEEGISTLAEELGSPHIFKAIDVTDDDAMHSFSKIVIDGHGAPNLLVNNAAIINNNAPLKNISSEEFTNIVAVNLGGIHNSIRAFLPAMENNGNGVIVNFSSYWGSSTAADVAPYCATKWGIEGLTRSLSQELPSGLAAVAFNPGIIDTDMLRSCFGEGAASYQSPEEWARTAVPALASLDSTDNGSSVTAPSQ
jgi:NAD(P)-dependent dehydrogenase (short-subunit alcohol dehydrogenase family)